MKFRTLLLLAATASAVGGGRSLRGRGGDDGHRLTAATCTSIIKLGYSPPPSDPDHPHYDPRHSESRRQRLNGYEGDGEEQHGGESFLLCELPSGLTLLLLPTSNAGVESFVPKVAGDILTLPRDGSLLAAAATAFATAVLHFVVPRDVGLVSAVAFARPAASVLRLGRDPSARVVAVYLLGLSPSVVHGDLLALHPRVDRKKIVEHDVTRASNFMCKAAPDDGWCDVDVLRAWKCDTLSDLSSSSRQQSTSFEKKSLFDGLKLQNIRKDLLAWVKDVWHRITKVWDGFRGSTNSVETSPNFVNQDSCVVSYEENVCVKEYVDASNSFNDVQIVVTFDDASLAKFHNATRASGPDQARYFYAVSNLRWDDTVDPEKLDFPCVPGNPVSRWRTLTDLDNSTCVNELADKSNAAFVHALESSNDENPHLRDVYLWNDKAEDGCDEADYGAYGMLVMTEEGCWENMHPDYMSIYDFTGYEARHPFTTTGVTYINNWTSVGILEYPDDHPMSHFEDYRYSYASTSRVNQGARYGAKDIAIMTLANKVVVNRGGGTLVCDSTNEVAPDLTLDDYFDVINRDYSTLEAPDQLCQQGDIGIPTGSFEISVHATGLNRTPPGLPSSDGNCSYSVRDRVPRIGTKGMIRSKAVVSTNYIAKSSDISFDEAATLLIVFLNVDFALGRRARLKKGDRVLIHSAAGGSCSLWSFLFCLVFGAIPETLIQALGEPMADQFSSINEHTIRLSWDVLRQLVYRFGQIIQTYDKDDESSAQQSSKASSIPLIAFASTLGVVMVLILCARFRGGGMAKDDGGGDDDGNDDDDADGDDDDDEDGGGNDDDYDDPWPSEGPGPGPGHGPDDGGGPGPGHGRGHGSSDGGSNGNSSNGHSSNGSSRNGSSSNGNSSNGSSGNGSSSNGNSSNGNSSNGNGSNGNGSNGNGGSNGNNGNNGNKRIDDKSPAKGGGSRTRAKGPAPRRNPGRPARKKGSYAPSDDTPEGTAAMESSPTTPTRNKRDNSGINPTPPSFGRRSRRGTRGGKRGKGKKPDVSPGKGADAGTAAGEGQGPVEAPIVAGRAADRAAAARAKKKKKDGAKDADSFDINDFSVHTVDVSNSLFSHLYIAKGDADAAAAPADGFNIPPSVNVEGGPIPMSPPTSPTKDARAARQTDGQRTDVSDGRQVDDGRGCSKGDGVETVHSSSQEPVDEGGAGERESDPTSASNDARSTMANPEEPPAEKETGASRQPVECAMETEESKVEDGAATEGVSTGGVATPPGRSHCDVNFHPSMVQSPAPPTTAMGAPPANVAPPPAPDPSTTTGAAASDAIPVPTLALPGGVSTYGGLEITSAQLADVFHGRKIDDVTMYALLLRAKDECLKLCDGKPHSHKVVVWRPTELEVFLRLPLNERVETMNGVASRLELPVMETQAAYCSGKANIKILTALNDRMFEGDGAPEPASDDSWKTKEGLHWSLLSYTFFTEERSLMCSDECQLYDSVASPRHRKGALAFAAAMRSMIELRYPQGQWTSKCHPSCVHAVEVPRQVGDVDCGYYVAAFAELAAPLGMFLPRGVHESTMSKANPRNIVVWRQCLLRDLLTSIHDETSEVVAAAIAAFSSTTGTNAVGPASSATASEQPPPVPRSRSDPSATDPFTPSPPPEEDGDEEPAAKRYRPDENIPDYGAGGDSFAKEDGGGEVDDPEVLAPGTDNVARRPGAAVEAGIGSAEGDGSEVGGGDAAGAGGGGDDGNAGDDNEEDGHAEEDGDDEEGGATCPPLRRSARSQRKRQRPKLAARCHLGPVDQGLNRGVRLPLDTKGHNEMLTSFIREQKYVGVDMVPNLNAPYKVRTRKSSKVIGGEVTISLENGLFRATEAAFGFDVTSYLVSRLGCLLDKLKKEQKLESFTKEQKLETFKRLIHDASIIKDVLHHTFEIKTYNCNMKKPLNFRSPKEVHEAWKKENNQRGLDTDSLTDRRKKEIFEAVVREIIKFLSK